MLRAGIIENRKFGGDRYYQYDHNEKQSLIKRFPTLLTGLAGLAVLIVAVVLICGRSFALNAQAGNTTDINRQSVNTNVANVAAGNQTSNQRGTITVTGDNGIVAANQDDGSDQLPAGCCGGNGAGETQGGNTGGGCCGQR